MTGIPIYSKRAKLLPKRCRPWRKEETFPVWWPSWVEKMPIPSPTLSAIRTAAREVGAHIHAGSLVEKDGPRYFNSSYLISPQGDILANYRKIHLFGYQSEEARILSAGNSICVVPTPLATFGLAACFDLRFPELFRRLVDAGVPVLVTVGLVEDRPADSPYKIQEPEDYQEPGSKIPAYCLEGLELRKLRAEKDAGETEKDRARHVAETAKRGHQGRLRA